MIYLFCHGRPDQSRREGTPFRPDLVETGGNPPPEGWPGAYPLPSDCRGWRDAPSDKVTPCRPTAAARLEVTPLRRVTPYRPARRRSEAGGNPPLPDSALVIRYKAAFKGLVRA
jgi:hypothetical protein